MSAAAASPVVTWGELTKDAPDLKLPVSGQADQTVTNQEAVAFLLRWAGMEESQLGTYPRDYNAMADKHGHDRRDCPVQPPPIPVPRRTWR